MRVTTTRVLTAALILSLGLTLPAHGTPRASAPSSAQPAPSAADTPRGRAESVLHRVQVALGLDGHAAARHANASSRGNDLTLDLVELTRRLPDLDPTDQAAARRLLARPTDGIAADPDGFGYGRRARPTSDCQVAPTPGSHVCVTWARATRDAVAPTDSDGDHVPDQVETTRDVVDHVWDVIVTHGGYQAPLPDAGAPSQGPDRKLDVYLTDLGDDYLYGYCNIDPLPDLGHRRVAPGFCVLDNDYAEDIFDNHTPLENLEVTAAHEFFHAVQFAYDVDEDRWLMEGTAAWMEDEVYDGINDNLQYLQQSQLRRAGRSLDYYSQSWQPYGSWSWWRFLSERYPDDDGTGLPTVIRAIWNRADESRPRHPGTYSLKATARTLAERGESLTRVYAAYGEANRHPAQSYTEGRLYPTVAPVRGATLTAAAPTVAPARLTLSHLTNKTVVLTAGAGLDGAGWTLTIRLNAPSRSHHPYAQVTVWRAGVPQPPTVVALDDEGHGRVTVPFGGPVASRVELTLTNAGQHYTCHRGTVLSCGGISRDDGAVTVYKAVASRATP